MAKVFNMSGLEQPSQEQQEANLEQFKAKRIPLGILRMELERLPPEELKKLLKSLHKERHELKSIDKPKKENVLAKLIGGLKF